VKNFDLASAAPGVVIVFNQPTWLDEISRRVIGDRELFAALNGDLGSGEFIYIPDSPVEQTRSDEGAKPGEAKA
jgi:hypothetical protein